MARGTFRASDEHRGCCQWLVVSSSWLVEKNQVWIPRAKGLVGGDRL